MNWTGGRLRRSRHAGTSLSALQRTHFAKARTQLQNGPPTILPLNFPVFVIANDGKTNLTQRALEEYHNTAPLAKRLGSINHRRSQDDARLVQSRGQRRRSRISSHEGNLTRHPQAVTNKTDSSSHRLYGVTQGHSPEPNLEAKRRELLQRQDWLRATILMPLKMDFVEDKNVERIGKRRRLREDEHECRKCMRYRTSIPAIDERANIDGKRPPHYHLHHDTISVRVGTSIHGSQKTRKENDVTSQQSRQSDLSDLMLLDAEDIALPHCGSSGVSTPLDFEEDFSVDTPASFTTNAGMPLSFPGRECEKNTTRLISLPVFYSSPRNDAVTTDNINESNNVAAVNAEAAAQANSKTYPDREAVSVESSGHLEIASSASPNCSSTPSATFEFASQMNTRAHGSGSVPQAKGKVASATSDCCWKKFLDISCSSTIVQNINTSPLSKATSEDLAALRNGTKAGTIEPWAAPPEDENPIENNFLPRPITAQRKFKCIRDPELVKTRNMSASKSSYSGSNSISSSRNEDSWRDFVLGDEMDADSSNTYEKHGHHNNFSRSRGETNASSVVFQTSSAKETISTSSTRRDSPSSNSYLVPALPQMAATSSPDPLNHFTNSIGSTDQKQKQCLPGSKLLFTKRAPFLGRRATGEGSTCGIGQRLGRSATTWGPQSPADDEDTIDE